MTTVKAEVLALGETFKDTRFVKPESTYNRQTLANPGCAAHVNSMA